MVCKNYPEQSASRENLDSRTQESKKLKKLDQEVFEMVKTIEEILSKDEITQFVKHHKAILSGPDGDSSLS